MARPRVLDDVKKGEITALASTGMTMSRIARYIGCDRKTIKRERTVDDAFDERIRRAQMGAELKPLQAIQRKSETHWRAAAWLLDRQDRKEAEQRARREAARNRDDVTIPKVDLVKLAGQVKDAVLSAVVFREDEAYLSRKIDQVFVNMVPQLSATPGEELPPYKPAWSPSDYMTGGDYSTSDATTDASNDVCNDASVDDLTVPPATQTEAEPDTLPPISRKVPPRKWIPPRGQTWQQSARNLEKSNPERWGKPASDQSPGVVVDWEKLQEFRDDLLAAIAKQRAEAAAKTCGEQRGDKTPTEKPNDSEKTELCVQSQIPAA